LNGGQNNFVGINGLGNVPFYVGHLIAFQGTQLRSQALGGADLEGGVPVTPSTPWLRAYAGVYGYQQQSNATTAGVRVRGEATVSNDLTLGVMVTHDALFGTNINGTIEFHFSGFKPTTYFPQLTTRGRMLQSVQRNWRVASHTYNQEVDVAAINPATHQPY